MLSQHGIKIKHGKLLIIKLLLITIKKSNSSAARDSGISFYPSTYVPICVHLFICTCGQIIPDRRSCFALARLSC